MRSSLEEVPWKGSKNASGESAYSEDTLLSKRKRSSMLTHTPDKPIKRGTVRAKPAFSVIVPCYNEEHCIRTTVQSLRNALCNEPPYQLILVDDGSTDRTTVILSELSAEDPELTVLTHDRNLGYGAALKNGIRHATGDVVVMTDADGTYPNERIGELIALSQDYDMVVGSRTGDDVHYPVLRSIPKVFLKAYASWLSGCSIPDLNSGMRAFRRDLAQHFLQIFPDGFSFTTTITLAFLTNRYTVHYLPISYSKRVGNSKIRPIRDTLQFMQLIVRTGIYFAPLRVFGPLILVFCLGFVISLFYDVFVLRDLTERTLLLLVFSTNTVFFALLADMIDKRSND
jgi:glycosyltransferase involved in cell wall biosynthesis